jgi:AraC-like DNA-binding protein
MKTKLADAAVKIWRPQHAQNIELVRGTFTTYSTPLHFHENLEINIKHGNAWEFYYRGTKHYIPPNTLVLIQPGEVHKSWCSVDDPNCIFRGLHIDSALLQQIATEVAGREKGTPFFPDPLVSDRNLSELVASFHAACEGVSPQLEQQSRVLDVLAQIVMRCADDRLSPQPLGKERQPIERVRDYLQEHYADDISLEQLVQIANLSAFHLNRVFRQTVGLPPHAYQTQIRIARAKTLLRKGWTIAHVAHAVGFASQSHFGWHFKRLLGVTPGQYVKDSKNLIEPQTRVG